MKPLIFIILNCLTFCHSYLVSEYIIQNEKCKMPQFRAVSDEIYPLYHYLNYVNCTEKELLTYTTVVDNIAYLHINKEAKHKYLQSKHNIECCYGYVRRDGTEEQPDFGISYTPCYSFNSTVMLTASTVFVRCKRQGRILYENVHATITITKSVHSKIKKLKDSLKGSNLKPLSVLIIAISGVARLNFERTMPITRGMLLSNNFTEFAGYHKIGDETSPNFNALFTGLDSAHTNILCGDEQGVRNKDCPMVWKDFRQAGYATAYAEDWVSMITKRHEGFKYPPTDYYFKPYMEAASKLGGLVVDEMPYCAGPESQGERILKLAEKFAITFKNHPSFGLFWMNTFSQNYLNSPSRLDQKLASFFMYLKNKGIFNDSMVILIADHGIQEGTIRETIQGYYEERLPMNYVSVPKWFHQRHPTKVNNVLENSKKLTSTFDMYMTLQDVLFMSTKDYFGQPAQGCESCGSIFSKLPAERSCAEAGVDFSWCTCFGKLNRDHPDLTPDVVTDALLFLDNYNHHKLKTRKYLNIVSTSMSYFNGSSYFLMTLETEIHVHLVLLKGTQKPITFNKIIISTTLRDR